MVQLSAKGVVGKVLKADRNPDNGITFCLSGVLARGCEQFDPVLPALPGSVIAYHTEGNRHRFDNLVHSVVKDLNELKPSGPIRIIGASLGGMEVPFVLERFRAENPSVDTGRIHAVLVDAPSGLESLMNPQAKLLKSPFVGVPLTHLPSLIKVPVGDDALPKMPDITVPTGLTPDEEDAFKRVIIETARSYMSGYPLSLLFDQTRWMIKVGANGSLARACRALDGVRATYVCCRRGNDVVNPVAVDHWHEWVPSLGYFPVAGTHCGFLQNQPEFNKAFREILA